MRIKVSRNLSIKTVKAKSASDSTAERKRMDNYKSLGEPIGLVKSQPNFNGFII